MLHDSQDLRIVSALVHTMYLNIKLNLKFQGSHEREVPFGPAEAAWDAHGRRPGHRAPQHAAKTRRPKRHLRRRHTQHAHQGCQISFALASFVSKWPLTYRARQKGFSWVLWLPSVLIGELCNLGKIFLLGPVRHSPVRRYDVVQALKKNWATTNLMAWIVSVWLLINCLHFPSIFLSLGTVINQWMTSLASPLCICRAGL